MSVSNFDPAGLLETDLLSLSMSTNDRAFLSNNSVDSQLSSVGANWVALSVLEVEQSLITEAIDRFIVGEPSIVIASSEDLTVSEIQSSAAGVAVLANPLTDPLTGETTTANLAADSPPYPGYLLRYIPGQALDRRPAVAQWQTQMQQRGWTIDVDGLYGPQSERVARQFQLEKGLAVDGIVGAQTWAAAFTENAPVVPVEQNPTSPALSGRINTVGLNLIKDFEGLRLNSYRDAVGVWTIGYGHTRTAGPGQRITNAQATALLQEDVSTFEDAVTQAVRVPITENQFAALVSFTYNVGSGALNSSTLLRRLNAGDTFGAADELLRWNRAGGQVLAGLTRRRVAERELFLS